MKLLKIPRRIHKQFQRTVNDSKNIELDLLRKKLTRNSFLSHINQNHEGEGVYYMYGNLHFIVNEEGAVIWLKNRQPSPVGWERNDRLYLKLSKRLGIKTDIAEVELKTQDVFLHDPRNSNRTDWEVEYGYVAEEQWIY